MPEEIGLFEAMSSQRAIRYFKTDPVPDELIERILEAGTRAPSGGNRQGWAFVVVRDQETRRKIADYYRAEYDLSGAGERVGGTSQQRRIYRSADALARHLHEVPVFIIACIQGDETGDAMNRGASIYPAVQNMLLAARGLGLGSVLTTRHRRFDAEVKELLGIPESFETAALLPIGYPAEGARYGPTKRVPLKEVAFYDRWGNS